MTRSKQQRNFRAPANARRIEGVVTITTDNKCSFCVGSKCCSYFAQQIDAPRSMRDFDLMLWQLSHCNVEFFKDDGGWFLLVNNPCLHLQADGRCGIYEKRPTICREHDNTHCEFDASPEKDWEYHFTDWQQLDDWCRKRFRSWDRRHGKT